MFRHLLIAAMSVMITGSTAFGQPLPTEGRTTAGRMWAAPPPQQSWTPLHALKPGEWIISQEPGAESKTEKKNGNGENGENGNGKKEEKPPEHISDNSFLIEEAYNQEAGVVQHIFNLVPLWNHQDGVREHDFLGLYVMELPLCSQKHQFSFAVPFLTLKEEFEGVTLVEEGGLGDIFLNYRYQLTTEDECGCRPAIAPRFTVILPTGDRERDLGFGELGYQFNLPISKQIEPWAVHFNAGFTYVPGVSVPLGGGLASPERDLHNYFVGGSVIYLMSYEFNLMLELLALWNYGLDDLGNRERTTDVILNPGFRWAVYTGDEIQWVLGASVPIGLTRDSPDIGVFGYMSVEHNFKKTEENGGE